jgi:hypothetical protein
VRRRAGGLPRRGRIRPWGAAILAGRGRRQVVGGGSRSREIDAAHEGIDVATRVQEVQHLGGEVEHDPVGLHQAGEAGVLAAGHGGDGGTEAAAVAVSHSGDDRERRVQVEHGIPIGIEEQLEQAHGVSLNRRPGPPG